MGSGRILLVDDDASIRKALGPLLRARGYDVDLAANGSEAIERWRLMSPELVVLDLGLPDRPGVDVCREIRAASAVPIVVLSARTTERDKVEALDLGADDYVTKPFGPEELLARIRAALRRQVPVGDTATGRLTVGELTIDFDRRRVRRGDEDIRLTPKEFELAALVARHAGRVLTHRTILRSIWGPHAVNQPEHLWVLIAQLRKKIEPDPAHPRYLLSEPWVGYRLAVDPED